MCGICTTIHFVSVASDIHNKDVLPLLQNRGPDGNHSTIVQLDQCLLVLQGCVLWLQGRCPHLQPYTDTCGNSLLWNGDVLSGLQVPDDQCDTEFLSQHLCAAKSELETLQLLSAIRGPWSLVYYHKALGRLYFGRDVIGRHSLLWSEHRNGRSDAKTPADVGAGTITESVCFESNAYHTICPGHENSVSHDCDDTKKFVCNCSVPSVANTTVSSVGGTTKQKEMVESKTNERTQFILTSVGTASDNLEEIPAYGLYYIDLNNLFETDTSLQCRRLCIHLIPWDTVPANVLAGLDVHISSSTLHSPVAHLLNMSLPDSETLATLAARTQGKPSLSDLASLPSFTVDVDRLTQLLTESISRRVRACPPFCQLCSLKSRQCSHCNHGCFQCNFEGIPCSHRNYENQLFSHCISHSQKCSHCRVAVMFSGGLDSAVLALLLDQTLPQQEEIDLINVAFPLKNSKKNLCVLNNKIKKNNNKARRQNKECKSVRALCDESVPSSEFVKENDSKSMHSITAESGISNLPISSVNSSSHNVPATLSVTTPLLPTATRISTPAINHVIEKEQDSDFSVPDRLSGRACLQQLQQLCPNRRWNFVEVNVTRQQLQQTRTSRIRHLLHPRQSVLDDSIGCALWWGARARGQVEGREYASPAKVLLLGSGADEQLCGYSRHRGRYLAGGWRTLTEEVLEEMARLHARNLGRDDRVLADHGRANRLPYLDEDVVSFLNSLPLWRKADLNLPRGVGEKLLLRVLAHRLGLSYAAGLPKRAIQFGSRIAKMEDSSEKGSQECARLTGDRE